MEEYYLNNSKCCAKLPTRSSDYLQQSNFLSEFGTKDDKQEARDNLGVTELLNELKALIDNKIIEYGGVAWDLKPTSEHTDRVLSSDAIYKTLLDYATEQELNSRFTSIWSMFLNKLDELEQRINSQSENGVALSNKFGDSETIGVSQKTLTKVIDNIYNRLGNCCGSPLELTMSVTPQYFATDTAQVTVTVRPSTEQFETLEVYMREGNGDEVLITELLIPQAGGIYKTEFPITIKETTTFRAVGTILGMTYTDQKTIMKEKTFYIGSGSSYQDVMIDANLKRFENTGIYTFTVRKDGDYIFIVMDEEEGSRIGTTILNGDTQPTILMNNVLVPMEIDSSNNNVTELTVFKSKQTYQAGEYPLEIRYNK